VIARCAAVAFVLSLAFIGCGDGRATVATWLGASDKPTPEPRAIDILCDPSSGSTCTDRTFREVLQVALREVADRPGSAVRIWMQGRSIETTRMIAEVRSARPRATGRRARADFDRRWIAKEYSLILSVTHMAVPKRMQRSPIAEAIGLIALAPPPVNGRRELMVVTDALEVSDYGDFECRPLPKPDRFARALARNNVLPPGSLAGVEVHFCHVDLGAIDRGRCAVSLGRAADIRTLWRAALTAAGASSVEIRQGGLDPTTNPRKDAPDV
jgi:hypothetical protein